MSAAEARLMYTSYAGFRALSPAAFTALPVRGAPGYRYPVSSMLVDPKEVRANGYPSAGMCFESSVCRGHSAGLTEIVRKLRKLLL